MDRAATPPNGSRRRVTALAVLAVVLAMGGLSYASVPLYRAFCRATGYGGTPQVATAAPAARGNRLLRVRFDANVAPGLPWTFVPETPWLDMRTGSTATVFYRVRNLSGRDTVANAQYNVAPDVAGFYFNKISCFCFSEQRLGPNETAELPVVFFLDPALETEAAMRDVDALTLSYTLHAVKASAPALAKGDTGRDGAAPRL